VNNFDEIINAVDNRTNRNDQPESETVDWTKQLQKEVAESKKTIQLLHTRADFLLSYLGIADNQSTDSKSTAVS